MNRKGGTFYLWKLRLLPKVSSNGASMETPESCAGDEAFLSIPSPQRHTSGGMDGT